MLKKELRRRVLKLERKWARRRLIRHIKNKLNELGDIFT